jgi:STE24 endopeptidase
LSAQVVRAAGGVVWRPAGDGIEVLLVHRPRYDDWSLPKGKLDPGESWEDGARREVEEETGVTGVLGPYLATSTYPDAKGRPKEVRWFELREPRGAFAANDEVDEVVWLSPDAARRRVTRPADVEVLHALDDHLEGADPTVMTETAEFPRLPSLWRQVPNRPDDWFSADELDRARRYRKPVSRARMLRLGVSTAVLLVLVFADVAPRLVDALDITNWVAQLIVIVALLELISTVVSTPFDAWLELRHDREWDLSTQTERGFAADLAKGLVLGFIINVVLLLPLLAVIRSTPTWWLWGWLVMVVFTIGLGFLYPVVIAPIFNTFTPLEDEDMNGRVDRIADIAGVQISGTYVADESKRSRRDNAYVAGLGATRRVVLFDTLLEHPPEVVEQVVAHEIGHWRLKHLRKQIPVIALLLLALFAGLKAFSGWDWIFEQAGVVTTGDIPLVGQPTALPLLVLAAQIGFGLLGLLTAWVSRAFERQADIEALDLLEQPQTMLDMQRGLHTKNLADLEPGLVKRLQASHPPAAERMALTSAWAAAKGLTVSPS